MHNPYALKPDAVTPLQLIKWVILDPTRLRSISSPLPKKAASLTMIRALFWGILLMGILFILSALVLPFWGLSDHFLRAEPPRPEIENPFQQWSVVAGFVLAERWLTWSLVFAGIGLAALLVAWQLGLIWGLALMLLGGIINSLSLGFAFEWLNWFVVGSIIGTAIGLTGGVYLKLKEGLAFSAVLTLVTGGGIGAFLWWQHGFPMEQDLSIVADAALSIAVGVFPAFVLFFYRLIFWPFYGLQNQLATHLLKNPYLYDNTVWFPMEKTKKRLIQQSWDDPQMGFQFADFLRNNRKLQHKLAYRIGHTATASLWYHHPFEPQLVAVPPLSPEAGIMKPSARWMNRLTEMREALVQAKDSTITPNKKQDYDTLYDSLEELEKLTIHEPKEWNAPYIRAIQKWKLLAADASSKY